ncbi:YdeI/OmpD-associated family protein [Pyxidicoccus parkwayensis]|uniref:YdeI/OmpD-associated family protein n=1 Tax=Pyxidicoccus parkwayensis TaxID=2813578 RepID=A0ABX7P6P4_9BACT|nr:YdeI/OmpD-associated family protein [Pyxidicoccus parkwaysis]QSQ26126.1 YdeI/OmpD-associated family protein [Pyxidicoccus parkwaysis]
MPATKKAVVKKAPAKKVAAKKSVATKTPAKKASLAGEAPILPFESQRAWDTWLAKHHASSRGVWLKLAKKAAGVPSVNYAEALEVALVWGWIDGQKQSFDDAWWLQKFTPRGPKSIWSKVNCEKVQVLIDAGKMQPSGLAAVESAKQDGRWAQAYEPPSKATVPEDLAAAFTANPKAAAFFATLNAANRYAVLWRVQTAKKPETRARRISDLVAMLARHEKLHP